MKTRSSIRKKAERAERGGGLPGGEDEQQRPVADHVHLRDQADAGDHDHVGEGQRQPEVLLGVRGAGVVAEPFADVGDHVEDAAGDGDEEDADDREADREQAQIQHRRTSLRALPASRRRTLTGGRA